MSIFTFKEKSDRKHWQFKSWWAKYRFLEVELNMLIRCIPNITLRVAKQTGEETGQVFLPHFCAPNSTGTGKIHVHTTVG